MKNFIAVLLCFAVIFAFAACSKKTTGSETTAVASAPLEEIPSNVVLDANGNPVTEVTFQYATNASGHYYTEANGSPATISSIEYKTHAAGDIVVGADGNPVTVTEFGFILDENNEPKLDENGVPLTTYVYNFATYPTVPGGTLPTTAPTNPVGNTNPSRNHKWISDEFMAKLPKLRDNVDEAISATTDKGHYANIRINELSYADFLKYIETCKKAGFTQSNTGTVIPGTAEAGKLYRYSSNANGLYVTLTYYTDEYPYRTCDLYITVADYDMLKEGVGEIKK